MRSRKGQIWSIDFSAGILLLAFILLIFILVWNNLAIRWNSASAYRQMETGAIFASEALISTGGEPVGWEMLGNISEAGALGLASGRNELSTPKIERLVLENSTSYDFIRARLGLQKYELGISIMSLDREDTIYEFGRFSSGMQDSVVLERLGILNRTPVIVRTEVWR